MKKIITFIFLWQAFYLKGQEISLSINSAIYYSPFYKGNVGYTNFLEGNYNLKKNFSIGSFIGIGELNNKSELNQDNSKYKINHLRAGLIAGFNVFRKKSAITIISVGLGAIYQNRTYIGKFTGKDNSDLFILQNESFFEAEIPIGIEHNFKLNKKLLLGVKSFIFIKPNYPIIGVSFGPKITYEIN